MADKTFGQFTQTALIEALEEMRNEVRRAAEGLTDAQLWQRPLPTSNSVGHLILHLTGNINYFIGAQLGNSGYVREREREFTESAPPGRAELLGGLDDAVATYRRVVSTLTEQQMMAAHPTERFGSVIKALIQVLAHFALHRGQISYIVRLVNPQPAA